MHDSRDLTTLADELGRLLQETDTSVRRLARLSGVSRRTLENWLYGQTIQPRSVEPVLRVASALNLPAAETDRLLQAAGQPPLASLLAGDVAVESGLLKDWRLAPNRLLGQRNTAVLEGGLLPGPATPFFGRAGSREDLTALLRRPDTRLVTVTGLGGSGKTRLALEAARDLVTWFDHGVYFVPLDNVTEKTGFWTAINTALRIPGDGSSDAQTLALDYLRAKHSLLLLDNFEHVLPLATELGSLLSGTRHLSLLVTSRFALDLSVEQLYPIGGLSLHDGPGSPAFNLYVETARRHMPGYKPGPDEEDEIITLCKAVEGLPLALELAATWRDVWRPEQLLDQLREDLRGVAHSAVDRPERQSNLWNLFDYSWQLLSADEQEAAVRLSILHGSFSSETALAIADCEPATLRRLVKASLVTRTGDGRLLTHRLVRQFLATKAEESGLKQEALEALFADVMLSWSATESSRLRETFQVRHYLNMRAEWQHIERAWWIAVGARRYDLLEMCWDIIFYFEARGNWGEGEAFFAETRRRIPLEEKRMQALLDEAESILATRLFELTRGVKLARRALAAYDELGVDTETATVGQYARLVLLTADFALNQAAFSEANIRALREATANYLATLTEVMLSLLDGVIAFNHQEYATAARVFEDALTFCGEGAYVVPIIRCFLGLALKYAGRLDAAEAQYRLALRQGLEIDVYPAVVSATNELTVLAAGGILGSASRQALEELALQMGSRRTVGRVAIVVAMQYLNLGLIGQANHLIRAGLGLIWREVSMAERSRLLGMITQAYLAVGLARNAPQVLAMFAPGQT